MRLRGPATLLVCCEVLAGAGEPPPPPDCDTLEDLYGEPIGESFQGAVGFYTQEGSPSTQPSSSFGVAVDDMVVEWREYKLDKDATACPPGSGQCAVLEMSSHRLYETNMLLSIRLVEPTPWKGAEGNDCNGDGDLTDIGRCRTSTPCTTDAACGNGTCIGGLCTAAVRACTTNADCASSGETCHAEAGGADDRDCNDNGIEDVTVFATSGAEPAGEVAVLDRAGPGSPFWSGAAAISATYDSEGVLFVARDGTQPAGVTARYDDRDYDGSGNACPNATDPTERGVVTAGTVIEMDAARFTLTHISMTDNGDGDGYADTNETVELALTLGNKSGRDLSEVVATIATSDPKIACVTRASAEIGLLPAGGSATNVTPLVFRVADVDRAGVGVDGAFKATFTVTVRAREFDILAKPITFDLDLDLDATGGGSAAPWREDFEVTSGFGQFTSMSLDLNKASLSASTGYRCQYHDPNNCGAVDCGNPYCFLGFTTASNNAYDWHIHSGEASDNNVARAYAGTRSLHWGVHPSTGARRDSTRFAQLDAVRTINPINLPTGPTSYPELVFAHQISLIDDRTTNTPRGEAADRAFVSIQLADAAGAAIGDWLKIYPYENDFDAQGTDEFVNCTFDPIDDGNNESSYFDPLDPYRRYGPSSTCMPEFAFVWHGDTDYRNAPGYIDAQHIGRAGDGPPLRGSIDRGTWVRPKFSLFPYRGRRVRLRFVATSIEAHPAVTVNDTGIGYDNSTGDDGWYLDDVRVDEAISSAATLSVDTRANAGLPICAACTSITAVLAATPNPVSAPGQPLALDASSSTADACRNAALQYQWWTDDGGDGTIGNAGDALMRDWTDGPTIADAPLVTTRYGVIVRCPSSPTCAPGVASTLATVNCPSTGTVAERFQPTIGFADKATVSWSGSARFDAVRGDLGLLRSGGLYAGSVLACLANNASGAFLTDGTAPAPGAGFYYLVRPAPARCNVAGLYGGGPAEKTGAGSRDDPAQGIPADPNRCP